MNTAKSSSRQITQAVLLAGLLLLMIFVVGYHCPIHLLFHIYCPGCGMSRALIALLQGNLIQSLSWHAMLIPTIAAGGAVLYFRKTGQSDLEKYIVYCWCAMMIAYWLFRLVLVFPYSPLFG